MKRLTMGSLFDGIGGFPLAALEYEIEPIWASEIERFPMLVTKLHFPRMQHVGDMDKDNVRTVAFQVPVELFEQFKAYLKRNGVKQNAFFLNCIQQALEQDGKADGE